MEPFLRDAMTFICCHDERLIEKHLLGFSLANRMPILALASIPLIPVKTLNLIEIQIGNHWTPVV